MEEFDGWYLHEHARVFGVCAALAGDLDAAGEATDEAFTRALERWDRVSAMAAPGAWVQTVAINCVRRSKRRRSHERPRLAMDGSSVVDPDLPDAALWSALRSLPTRQQTAVVMRYIGDQSEAVIAEAMGVSRGTVASNLSDARSRLRTLLGELTDEGDK